MSERIVFCRTCSSLEPKPINDGWSGVPRHEGWLVAQPEMIRGEVLLENLGAWCSEECMRADPHYKEFETGKEVTDAYTRFAEAVGSDLIGALARSRGVTREEAQRIFDNGGDALIKHNRRKKRGD